MSETKPVRKTLARSFGELSVGESQDTIAVITSQALPSAPSSSGNRAREHRWRENCVDTVASQT